jgi:hypothetical protein
MLQHSPKLGEILMKHTALSQAQLDDALKIQQKEGGMLGEVLVRRNLMHIKSDDAQKIAFPGMLVRKVGRTPVTTVAEFAAAVEQESAAEGVVLQIRTPRGNSVVLLKKS